MNELFTGVLLTGSGKFSSFLCSKKALREENYKVQYGTMRLWLYQLTGFALDSFGSGMVLRFTKCTKENLALGD